MPKRPYPRYRHRHYAVLLAACRDPSQTQKEIAKATGYTRRRYRASSARRIFNRHTVG